MTDTITILVPDMTCGHCEKAIREALREVNEAANVEVELGTHIVKVDLPAGDALAAIVDAGYTPQLVK